MSAHGRILVNEFLQSDVPNVYVVGDYAAAVSSGKSVPMTAQAATAMAAAAAKNIAAALSGKPLEPFVYHERGQLVSLGRWLAAAEVYGVPLFGHFAWWMWRTIYASKLIGFKNRLRVILDWTIDMFYPRSTSKI
jgi:NADH dehydrogenase